MTNSENYEIRLSPKFNTTYKKLIKSHYKKNKQGLKDFEVLFEGIIAALELNPIDDSVGRKEPVKKIGNPEKFEIRKIRWNNLPGLSGEASFCRIIYTVNLEIKRVTLIWIYTHKEYKKPHSRPPEKQLRKEILLAQDNQ